MKLIIDRAIRFYQKFISPLKGPTCMFEPTCSEYTRQAVSRHGVLRGLGLGINRVRRCHPWQSKFGPDPVPERTGNK